MKRTGQATAGDKREAILSAAVSLFGNYGYRRTSIDDIAREAGIAKGTVYLYFSSKEEIFRALSRQVIERVVSGAHQALTTPGPVETRLLAMLEAKFGYVFETVHRTAHARELVDSQNRLSQDICARGDRQYVKLLTALVENATSANQLNPARMGLTPASTAALIISAAHGITTDIKPALYHERLAQLVRVFAAGLAAGSEGPAPAL